MELGRPQWIPGPPAGIESPHERERSAEGGASVTVSNISVLIAAASVLVASAFYAFQVRNQTRVRKADLVMRLYATFDSLQFQEAFHKFFWADVHDFDSLMAAADGQRHVGTYLFTFYEEVGILLRHGLIDFDLVSALLGNSGRQLWEKIAPAIKEARVLSDDPQLYEHFEYLYDEMVRRSPQPPHPIELADRDTSEAEA